ncbi:MAG: NADH-quinone oxidoreductase subunit C [Candidatus Omnitrophica bacterium]|nr:NADH-quinone oxidoreductase subunit C [Candidatus Omnitrophota bacterium]
MPTASDELIARLRARFPQHILAAHAYRGQPTVTIRREGLLEVATALRDDPATAFDVLMDLCGADYAWFGMSQASAPTLRTPSPLPYFMSPAPSAERWERGVPHDAQHRFEVVYHFYSTAHRRRLRLKVPVSFAEPSVPSLAGLWAAANWYEREVWDMFGVVFEGHPNLKRILMYESFQGHPLRKDYPINKRQPIIGPVN